VQVRTGIGIGRERLLDAEGDGFKPRSLALIHAILTTKLHRMLAFIHVQARRAAKSLRMLPKLATRTANAIGAVADVEGRVIVLFKSVERSPKVCREEVSNASFADQRRLGSVLVS